MGLGGATHLGSRGRGLSQALSTKPSLRFFQGNSCPQALRAECVYDQEASSGDQTPGSTVSLRTAEQMTLSSEPPRTSSLPAWGCGYPGLLQGYKMPGAAEA